MVQSFAEVPFTSTAARSCELVAGASNSRYTGIVRRDRLRMVTPAISTTATALSVVTRRLQLARSMRTSAVIGNMWTARVRDRAIAMAVRVRSRERSPCGDVRARRRSRGSRLHLKSEPREPFVSVESVPTWRYQVLDVRLPFRMVPSSDSERRLHVSAWRDVAIATDDESNLRSSAPSVKHSRYRYHSRYQSHVERPVLAPSKCRATMLI